MSAFSSVSLAPRDPILGLNEQYNADNNTKKVNLGVGIYFDDNGKLPLFKAVQQAENALIATPKPRGYLPIDGLPAYVKSVQKLVFGNESNALQSGRVVTIQSLAGTGALKTGADFLKQFHSSSQVLITNPSWENHLQLFQNAGFEVNSYRYYDETAHAIDFQGLIADLQAAQTGTIVILHACCHNPTGYDLSAQQWDQIIDVIKTKQLMPFIDMAYQGFSQGLREDSEVVAKFIDSNLNFLLATSFSKNFGLYGERIGSLSVVTSNKEEAKYVLSQLKVLVRTNYSNPPTHAASIVTAILGDAHLRQLWEDELMQMRIRIKEMREALVKGLQKAGVQKDFTFITQQVGMFSYSGLNKDQMQRLRSEFGVYGTDTGRICVAALNSKNIDYVSQSIAKVI